MGKGYGLGMAMILALAACGKDRTGEETNASDAPKMAVGTGTGVIAAAETVPVGTQNADSADDPAIWADPANPSRAVIFGTDKKAGLYVYRLDGSVLQHFAGGLPNNVDLRDGFEIGGRKQVLVAASDRDPKRFGIALFLFDPGSLQTRYWGLVPVDLEEPYGLCLGRRGDAFIALINGTDGQVRQIAISAGPDGAPRGTVEKRYAVGSQTEGCVVDDASGDVYVGEEAKGIWKYSIDPAQGGKRVQIATAPGKALVPDVEGLTLIRDGSRQYLLASSQGDSAYAVWEVGGQPRYAGRFSIVGSPAADAVTGTDGIAALGGQVGPFGSGLFVAQDDEDETPGQTGERQNFKLVDWARIKAALKLD